MTLLELPPEVRALIYSFCFPPPHAPVQLIPYRASSPACRLHLPLSLYLVCKLIYAELPRLSSKLASLDLTYVIQGPLIGRYWRPEHGSRKDDDPDLRHFQKVLRFAERVRLVGDGKPKTQVRSIQCSSRPLRPGAECALRVLEIQPVMWGRRVMEHTVLSCLGTLVSHPDVAHRLEIRLIRDDEGEGSNDELEEIEAWLRGYQGLRIRY